MKSGSGQLFPTTLGSEEARIVARIGQQVRLVPTEGAYQKEKQGVVTSLTKTQVGVTADGERYEVRYRVSDGLPVRKIDREFPCYRVVT